MSTKLLLKNPQKKRVVIPSNLDRAAKKDGGTVDWNYLLTRMD